MGSRSKGCQRCRTRKIKCDERLPQCSQCVCSRKQCPGPVVGNTFIAVGSPAKRCGTRPRKQTNSISSRVPSACLSGSRNLDLHPSNQAPRSSESMHNRVVTLQEYLLHVCSIPAIYSPVAHKLDPFSSLPIIVDVSAQTLIEIYLFYYPRKISTMGPTSIWFPLAASDAVLLETTFFVCATYYELLRGSCCNVIPMKYKDSLLRLINEMLRDPILGVGDGIICAIALLSGSEVINGNMQDWKTHMDGLMRMVRIRGGFQNLGLDGMTVKVIAAAYSYGAIQTTVGYEFATKADLEVALLSQQRVSSFTKVSAQKPQAQGLLSLFVPLDEPSKELSECLQAVQDLASDFHSTHFSKWTDADIVRMDERLTIIMYKLTSLKRAPTEPRRKSDFPMQECSRLCAFLFISVYLRDRPRHAFVHMDILKQMKPHLQEMQQYSFRRSQLKAVMWILCVGATVALDTPAEAWFIAEIANLLIRIQFLQWESIEASLQEIMKSQYLIILSKLVWQKARRKLQCLGVLVPE